MAIMQILIFINLIKCNEIVNKGSEFYFSLVTTWLSLLSNMYKLKMESVMFDEPFILYCMNCMKAKQGWVPYMYHLRQNIFNRDLDYSKIELSI